MANLKMLVIGDFEHEHSELDYSWQGDRTLAVRHGNEIVKQHYVPKKFSTVQMVDKNYEVTTLKVPKVVKPFFEEIDDEENAPL